MIRLLAFVFATLCFAGSAHAFISVVPSSCVPNLPTIRDNRALVGNAFVRHAGDNTDPIDLTCPIMPFAAMFSNWRIRITYVDSTGANANAFVRARLYRMGVENDNPVQLAAVNSNSDSATDLNTVASDAFSHNFDFDANVYWFHIELERASPSQTVILHSVALRTVSVTSDIRAKHSITLLGHLANGLGFYRFSYNGSDKAYVGVMAQEVEAIRPDAVTPGSDGYLGVFYDKLGLHMQSYEDWVASGARIPAITP